MTGGATPAPVDSLGTSPGSSSTFLGHGNLVKRVTGKKKFREMSCSFYNTLEFYFYYGFELDRWIKHGYWTSTIFSLELV